jgi:RNase P/RNase MRP subunit p30
MSRKRKNSINRLRLELKYLRKYQKELMVPSDAELIDGCIRAVKTDLQQLRRRA